MRIRELMLLEDYCRLLEAVGHRHDDESPVVERPARSPSATTRASRLAPLTVTRLAWIATWMTNRSIRSCGRHAPSRRETVTCTRAARPLLRERANDALTFLVIEAQTIVFVERRLAAVGA